MVHMHEYIMIINDHNDTIELWVKANHHYADLLSLGILLTWIFHMRALPECDILQYVSFSSDMYGTMPVY